MDYKNKQLRLTDISDNSETSEHVGTLRYDTSKKLNSTEDINKIDVIIQPRSETLIGIPTPDHEEDETLLVPAQTLDESILCSNTINRVHGRQILVAAINPNEFPVKITEQQIRSIKFETFMETKIHSIQKIPEHKGKGSRLSALRETLNTEHLN